jgi:hypothetical protein
MKYDLHIHSKYSNDGILDPQKIVKIAIKKGLDGIAVTDHNTIKGGLKTKEYETQDFKVLVGSEVSTTRGEIIGLFLSEEIKSREFHEVADEIRDQGGLVIVPHPFDELRKASFGIKNEDAKYLDTIEVFNSRCIYQKYNDRAAVYAKKHNLSQVGGSDAHFPYEIGKAGIILESHEVKNAILNKDLEIFGNKSIFLNHGITKVLKLWRKTRSGW